MSSWINDSSKSALLWSFIGTVGLSFILLISDILLARLLTPIDFGLIGMLFIFTAVGRVIVESGLNESIIRSEDINEKDYATVFLSNVSASILICFVCYAASSLIADFYNQKELASILSWYTLGLPCIGFSTIQMTRLIKVMNFKLITQAQLLSRIIAAIVALYMAYEGYGVWSLVAFFVVYEFSLAVSLPVLSRWLPKIYFSSKYYRKHWKYGYKLTINRILSELMLNLNYVFIGKFFAVNILGYYSNANKLKQYPVTILSGAINKVSFPLLVSLRNKPDEMKSAYLELLQVIAFLVIPMLVGASAVANDLFLVILGEQWLEAIPFFQILCILGVLTPIHAHNIDILKVYGRSDLILTLGLFKHGLTAINLVIAYFWGIYSLLYGQVICSLIALYINSYHNERLLGVTLLEQLKAIASSMLLVSAMYAVVRLFYLLEFSSDPVIRLCLAVFIGAFCYLLLAFLCKVRALKLLLKLMSRKKDSAAPIDSF